MNHYEIEVGKWLITPNHIDCSNVIGADYLIRRDELLSLGSASRSNLYDWLIHLVEKKSVKDEVYSLNTAFILAAKLWELRLDGDILMNTIQEQKAYWDSLYASN
jgi:hypothetical protein